MIPALGFFTEGFEELGQLYGVEPGLIRLLCGRVINTPVQKDKNQEQEKIFYFVG
jgi:hypothetical protein